MILKQNYLRIVTLAFGCVLFFFTLNIYAAPITPVTTVYRADSRDYHDVFKNGFISWGNNINFAAHVTGISGFSRQRNSAFISTTASLAFADEYARDRGRNFGHFFYIYNIRATDNMYSALATMNHLYTIHNEDMNSVMRRFLDEEQEWSALIDIPGDQIRSVTIVEYYQGHYYESNINNPYYLAEETHASTEPFTGSDHLALDDNAPFLLVGPGIGASFVSSADSAVAPTPVWTFSCCFGSNESEI